MMNAALKVVNQLKPMLPEFHTRRMRKAFISQYCNINSSDGSIPKHILRSIYAELALDATKDQNPTLDSRVRQAILAEDSDMILDLRHLNKGRPNDTFNEFFNILSAKVEELTAVDERRHNVAHFSKYISVKDLISDVENDLPNGTPVPSE